MWEKTSCTDPYKKRPNILILMVDQERFPSVYETKGLKEWRQENLVTHELLRKNGMEFLNHYAGSTACSPSRATLYTGQYPSLHGVTQTPGAAKDSFDPDVFWLDPNTVPTMGDYFRTAGYRTFWKGKWHASDEDILIPGTHNALPSYHTKTGVPSKKKERLYQKANRLHPFGFSEWIGPEPHGTNPRNSGSSAGIGTSGRDEVYSADTVKLIKSLEKNSTKDDTPWFIMCSFLNPHDIALYGVLTANAPNFNFDVDPTCRIFKQLRQLGNHFYRNQSPRKAIASHTRKHCSQSWTTMFIAKCITAYKKRLIRKCLKSLKPFNDRVL